MAKRQKTTQRSNLQGIESESQVELLGMMRTLIEDSEEKKDERVKDEKAADIAGMYLRTAALEWAREHLDPLFQNDDNRIAQVEIMLRAARHMRRTKILDGDPIPSIRLADGSVVPLTSRLLQLMDRDQVIQAENPDDNKPPSKASRMAKDGREARAKIKRVAEQVIREGEISA